MSDVEIHLSDLQDVIEVYMYMYSVLKMRFICCLHYIRT